MGQAEYNDDGRVAARNGVKELGQSDQEAAYGCDDNYADHDERDVLRPELYVEFETEIDDYDLECACDGVFLADSIKYDVYSRLE